MTIPRRDGAAVLESRSINPEVYKQQWRWKEGDLTVTRSTQWSGPGCHDGCGLLYYTDAHGKLVKVEGDPNAAFNSGALCMRCLDLTEVADHRDRLKWPLKRVGNRGENKWERISWDEAYDTIVEKTRYYQKNFGNESIVVLTGTGRNTWWQAQLIGYHAFQTPNVLGGFLSGDSCYAPRAAQMAVMNGDFLIADLSQFLPDRFDSPEFVLPKVILIWGNNPIISNPDGFFGHWIIQAMKRGTKLIVADPRLTFLASKADVWLRLRPGTDAALALALLNVIINENLYDKAFVDKWCYGFEDLKARVQQYPPEKVSEITWIPKEKIQAAARLFAKDKPSSVQWGLKVDQSVSGISTAQSLNALWSITGNVDNPGGMVIARPAHGLGYWVDAFGPNLVPPELKEKRIGTTEYPMRAQGVIGAAHTDACLVRIESEKPYSVKMAFHQSTNFLANMATESPRVYAAMKKVEFNVVQEIFMTPTAVAFADIVLPMALGFERDGFREWWTPTRTITKICQHHECKSDEDVICDLSNRLNPAGAKGKNTLEWLNTVCKEANAPFTMEELRERVIIWPKHEYRRHERGLLRPDGEPGFNTGTGKIELRITMMEEFGHDPLPWYEEPRESPYSTPLLAQKYPLVLTTGYRSWEFFHSEHRQLRTMREFHPDPMVEVHPETAARYGVQEGDWVWIENQRGRCKQKVRFNKTMDPRVVMAEHGWWFPERKGAEPELFGVFDSNINNLTIQNDIGETGFGAPYVGLLCKIYKVDPTKDEVMPTKQVVELGGFGYVKK